jgi:tetratricopeptide (TPR) repeat protein
LLGRCLLKQNKATEAISPLSLAASLRPADPDSAEALRRAYRQTGDTANAQFWEKRYVTLRDNADARRKWEQETTARPENRHAHEMLATYLAKEGDINGCARQYSLALKVPPDHPRVLLATARALNEGGFPVDALPLARRVRAITQSNPEAFEVLGDILVSLGRTHEAAINYVQIRDWHKERIPEYQRKIAEANARVNASKSPTEIALRQAMRAQDPATKEQYLKDALVADPENTRALRELLKLQFGAAHLEDATDTAKRLMDVSPEDGLAHTLYCLLYLQKQPEKPLSEAEVQAANQHLQIADADSSVAGTVYYARGVLALRQGNPRQAIEHLEKAQKVDPNAIAVYARLVDARRAVGDTAGAQKAQAQFDRLKSL